MNQTMFNSDVEQSKYLSSTDIIQDAHQAISKTSSSTYRLHTSRSGNQVLAFNSFSDYKTPFHNREFDPVSSESHEVLGFISTKVNPKFSINKAVVELFEHHFNELLELPNRHINGPLVITGQGLGGLLAILFALKYQHAVDEAESNGSKTAKRPICITFGAPLLGDEALTRAISERPQWTSCFLNVVAKMDTLASFFSSNTLYKPFGTFLFCTETGGHAAFEDQETILAVLDNLASSNAGNSQMHDYTNDLASMRQKILYRGTSDLGESNLNPLRAGVMLQFQEIGMLDDNSHHLIAKTEDKRVKMIKSKRRVSVHEPAKKLNEMKISLTYMEWYMKTSKSKGGYYDSYKKAEGKDEIEKQQLIMKHQRILNQYWQRLVEEKNGMPQKEGAKLRTRWLYGGTNYRRIVEPLDIAYHYKMGKKNEMGDTNYLSNRSNHYELLEKWSEEDKKNQKPNDKKTKAASLTEDSCFWAHVEEALVLLRAKNGDPSSIAIKNKNFEEYVWKAINDFSVSPDVFLKGSSLMTWWEEYKGCLQDSPDSHVVEFIQYMKDNKYDEYQ